MDSDVQTLLDETYALVKQGRYSEVLEKNGSNVFRRQMELHVRLAEVQTMNESLESGELNRLSGFCFLLGSPMTYVGATYRWYEPMAVFGVFLLFLGLSILIAKGLNHEFS